MNTATLDVTALKAALFAVSTEETRYYLNGVLIEVSADSVTYVATDGHILFAHHATVAEPNTLTGAWIIPSETIKGIKLTRANKSVPFATLRTAENESLTLTLADGAFVGFRPIDGSFPDWRRVVPEPTGKFKQGLQFNPNLLARLWKAGEAFDCAKPTITYNEEGPALLAYGDRTDLIGVIMPMRAVATPTVVPAWGKVSHVHEVRAAA